MNKRYRLVGICIFFMLATAVIGCSASSNGDTEKTKDNGEGTENTATNVTEGSYPVTIENGDRALTIEEPPERAVALLQQDAELMVALGLEDKLVGYSLVSENTPSEYEDKLEDIPVLADTIPSKEVLLEADPDFVIGTEVDFIDNGVGTVEELEDLGIDSYVTKLKKPKTIENQVYKEIEDISRAFGIEERGEALIESMQGEIDDITEQIGDVEEPLKVFYMNGGEDGSARTTGNDSLDTRLIELAGGENIFSDVDDYLFDVSWEEVVERNPDVIVLSFCCGTGPDDLQEVIANNEALKGVTAVENENYVAAEVEDTTGTVRIPSGLKTLAKGFYPERFN